MYTDLDVSSVPPAEVSAWPMKSFVSADVRVEIGENFGTKTLCY